MESKTPIQAVISRAITQRYMIRGERNAGAREVEREVERHWEREVERDQRER